MSHMQMRTFSFNYLILTAGLLFISCSKDNIQPTKLGDIQLSFKIDGIEHSIGIDSSATTIEPYTSDQNGYWVKNSLGRGNYAFIDYEFHFNSDNYSGMFEFRNLYDTTLLIVENYESSRDWWEFKDIDNFYKSFNSNNYDFLPEPNPEFYPGMIFRFRKNNEIEYQTYLDYNHLRDTVINYEQGQFVITQQHPFEHPDFGLGIKISGEFNCELFQLVTHENVTLTEGQFTMFFKKP